MEITLELLRQAYSRVLSISYYHIFYILTAIDILTGYARAFKQKDLDSKVGMKGLMKHLCVVAIVVMICPYLWILQKAEVAIFIITAININNAISIMENLNVVAPNMLPEAISQYLRRAKSNIDNQILPIDKGEKVGDDGK